MCSGKSSISPSLIANYLLERVSGVRNAVALVKKDEPERKPQLVNAIRTIFQGDLLATMVFEFGEPIFIADVTELAEQVATELLLA